MKNKITTLLSNIGKLFRWIPERQCALLLSAIAWSLSSGRKPKDGLKLLLRLNNKIYALTGRIACDYGGGLHPKHWLMQYHEFFANRIHPQERVIDIGCGNGALAYDIAEHSGAMVTGIELNKQNVLEAKKRYAHNRVDYVQGDVLRDLPAGSFDVGVMSNVLEHLPDRVSFLRFAQEKLGIKRWLIRVPLYERDWRVPMMKELNLDYRLDQTHFTEYTQKSFSEEMSQAGLEIVYKETIWGEIWAEMRPSHNS